MLWRQIVRTVNGEHLLKKIRRNSPANSGFGIPNGARDGKHIKRNWLPKRISISLLPRIAAFFFAYSMQTFYFVGMHNQTQFSIALFLKIMC